MTWFGIRGVAIAALFVLYRRIAARRRSVLV